MAKKSKKIEPYVDKVVPKGTILPEVIRPGQPTKYDENLCEKLVEHMSGGNSFESFGAIAGCGRSSLYEWASRHPQFSDAQKRGRELLTKYWEDLLREAAKGTLHRIVKEEPVIEDGKPVIDPTTGKVLMRYEYAPAMANAACLIFACKNMAGMSDSRNVSLTGADGGPIQVQPVESMTNEQLMEKLKEIAKKAVEEDQ